MVMTKQELIASLQNEVRIVLHLASKVDRGKLDYRPTAKQRSTIELLQYVSMMGPTYVQYIKTASKDASIWESAAAAAAKRDFDQTVAAIAAQHDSYASLLGDMTDADLRTKSMAADGSTTTKGASLVNAVLCGCAAYRTQLFLYLKASGREELGTMNLWAGLDAPAP
jgi:hypothetical protein